ncbi:PREDICTED: sodium-dependent serotonin transporter-like, partial [Rhagoletis zephyria]|uniref:sodium-dependent serotonin transporter-like n=1 Tax=Rhagoletis zephyria TaxID=28612 RepID=UPI000811440A
MPPTALGAGGVTKSISCNAEWCIAAPCSSSDELNHKGCIGGGGSSASKPPTMQLSNSSASLLKASKTKATTYLQLYCHNYSHNHSHNGGSCAGGGGSGGGPHDEPEREHWDKKIEFLLAVIGFAVDLGNVWRFPYVCYRNGGGAFLVAYCIMLLFGGLPLFFLELALGQYFSSGCLTIWKRLCPVMKGLGYAICMIDIYMGMYYNTIISWSLYYLYVSCQSLVNFSLPWDDCSHAWNTDRCQTLEQPAVELSSVSPAEEYFLNHVLQINTSSGIDSLGPIRSSLAVCLMLIFLVVYFSLWKGVKSTGKVVWVTALMPYFVIFVFLIRATTLEGAIDGIRFYLEPDWSKLKSINVWIDAATQIFFSLGPGFGTLMALSSYNKFHNNCYRDAILTSSINCLTSFIAGFVTFSILGFMSKKLNKDISTVVADGPGLVFVVYPEAISTMYGSVFFSILFFVMLITL